MKTNIKLQTLFVLKLRKRAICIIYLTIISIYIIINQIQFNSIPLITNIWTHQCYIYIFYELPLKSFNFAKYYPTYDYFNSENGLFLPTIPIYTLEAFTYPY